MKYENDPYDFSLPGEVLVGQVLKERHLTIAAAESCTGGLVTSRLTDVPGSSEYVMGSIVSYSNEVKEKLVGVRHETLVKHGAVSGETAAEMAEGVRKAIGTDVGIATTGIAGPGGGTEEKPVGLVYTAVATGKHTWVCHTTFTGTREQIKQQASETVLAMAFGMLANECDEQDTQE
ncbi:CinA family protein [uncultured Selenomonas sp.]|uniref:CinA family protein n=1 Tax=uncultured Selenomonas sp. TaxID=159275 RepID=UPI0025E83AFD|nr:CinA family protein [uncultured Selenomonas sp.]